MFSEAPMLRYILVDTTMFGPGDDVEQTQKDLCWWMEALTQRNQDYLAQRPSTPRLYKSGVRYTTPMQFAGECEEVKALRDVLGGDAKKVEGTLSRLQQVFGGERFRDIGRIIENGGGDCDNLACWRAAELRQAGIKAKPFMTKRRRPDGGVTYHALVLWPPFGDVAYETTEDPSLLLGMGGPARKADRDEEIRKNQERCDILRARKNKPNTDDVIKELEALFGSYR
jgi:hypothetical protein